MAQTYSRVHINLHMSVYRTKQNIDTVTCTSSKLLNYAKLSFISHSWIKKIQTKQKTSSCTYPSYTLTLHSYHQPNSYSTSCIKELKTLHLQYISPDHTIRVWHCARALTSCHFNISIHSSPIQPTKKDRCFDTYSLYNPSNSYLRRPFSFLSTQ